jgi:hypothetical protein
MAAAPRLSTISRTSSPRTRFATLIPRPLSTHPSTHTLGSSLYLSPHARPSPHWLAPAARNQVTARQRRQTESAARLHPARRRRRRVRAGLTWRGPPPLQYSEHLQIPCPTCSRYFPSSQMGKPSILDSPLFPQPLCLLSLSPTTYLVPAADLASPSLDSDTYRPAAVSVARSLHCFSFLSTCPSLSSPATALLAGACCLCLACNRAAG